MANHPWHEISLRTQGDISTGRRTKVSRRVRQIKTQKKSEILMRYSLQGRIGRPQNPKRLAAHLTDTFAYHLGDAKIMR